MKTKEFKEGDWCFHEFRLCQILKVENGRVKSVTDGYVDIGGDSTNECVPMSIEAKNISDMVADEYDALHKLAGNMNLNFPDIHATFVNYWLSLCDYNQQKKASLYETAQKHLFELSKAIKDKITVMKGEEVYGIPILRR